MKVSQLREVLAHLNDDTNIAVAVRTNSTDPESLYDEHEADMIGVLVQSSFDDELFDNKLENTPSDITFRLIFY
jgi:hypothetical protein